MPSPSEPKQKKLHFDGSWVRLGPKGAEEVRRNSREWELFRALLRNEPVDWLEGFVLFRTWREETQVGDYPHLFWRVTSQVPAELRKQPFEIEAKLDHPPGKSTYWRLAPSAERAIESNIGKAVRTAQKSGEQFRAGRPGAGWSLIQEAYDKYQDPKSLCQALIYSQTLPKDCKPYETCLRGIRQLLEERRNVLMHALFRVLCLASDKRQGITEEVATLALDRWLKEFLQIRQVLLLISGHKFRAPNASTAAIEEFVALVQKCRECIEAVTEVKARYEAGDKFALRELALAEEEMATFLKRLVDCDAVDRVSEEIIAYYKELPYRRIDYRMVREHRQAAVATFIDSTHDTADNPDALYFAFWTYFSDFIDTFDRKGGIPAVLKSEGGSQEKWQSYAHILENMVDEEEARHRLRQLFDLIRGQLGEERDGVAPPCGGLCPLGERVYLQSVEEVLKIGDPKESAQWFRPAGPIAADFADKKVHRRSAVDTLKRESANNPVYLLVGKAATGKTVIVRTLIYELHEEGQKDAYYFDIAPQTDFNEGQLIREIRAVNGAIVIENIHLAPRKVQQVYSRFKHDKDRHILFTARYLDKRYENMFAESLSGIRSLPLEPLDEVDGIISCFCSDSTTPRIVAKRIPQILEVCRGDYWLLAIALQGCAMAHGAGEPQSWIASEVQRYIENLETCGDPHDDQYPGILLALSLLYIQEVLTAEPYLTDRLGFAKSALDDLAKRGEITRQKNPTGHIFYGLPHSSRAKAYSDHAIRYRNPKQPVGYEDCLYEYATTDVPNGLEAVTASTTAGVAERVVDRLFRAGQIPRLIEREQRLLAICSLALPPLSHDLQVEIMTDERVLDSLAKRIRESEKIAECAVILAAVFRAGLAAGESLLQRVGVHEFSSRISRSVDFDDATAFFQALPYCDGKCREIICEALEIGPLVDRLLSVPDEVALKFLAHVFFADPVIGDRLTEEWGLWRAHPCGRPSTADMGRYWDAWSHYWLFFEDNMFNTEGIQKLGVDIVDPVLVVGAGQGLLMEQLLQRGFKVDGVDLSPRMIEHAKMRRHIDLIHADASNLPFADGSYKTCIVATGVVDFMDDEQQIASTVDEAQRVTDASGKTLLAFYRFHPRAEKFMKRIGVITNNGYWRARRTYQLMNMNPRAFLTALRMESNVSMLGAICTLIKCQMFLPKKERQSMRTWDLLRRSGVRIGGVDAIIEATPELVPYRVEPQIRSLFQRLSKPPYEVYPYDRCTIVLLAPKCR